MLLLVLSLAAAPAAGAERPEPECEPSDGLLCLPGLSFPAVPQSGLSTGPPGVFYRDFYLGVVTLTADSGLALEGGFRRQNLGRTPADLRAAASRSYFGYELYQFQVGELDRGAGVSVQSIDAEIESQFPERRYTGEGFYLFADLTYRHFPQYEFFGLGSDSRRQDRTDFLFRGASYDGVAGYQINRHWGVSVRGGVFQGGIGRGTDDRFPDTVDLDPASLPGLERQPDFFHFSALMQVDGRNQPAHPRSGGMVGVLFSRFDDLGEGGSAFSRLLVDARYFQPVTPRGVLAGRFLTAFTRRETGGEIPFYFQPTLGGSDTLRGFESYRFRGRNALLLSVEYRWDLLSFLELAGFVDAGKAFESTSEFDVNDLAGSYGAGLRFKTAAAVLVRIDVGRSREGTRVNLRLGPAW